MNPRCRQHAAPLKPGGLLISFVPNKYHTMFFNIFVRAYVPETKGRTLEDIERDLHPVKTRGTPAPA